MNDEGLGSESEVAYAAPYYEVFADGRRIYEGYDWCEWILVSRDACKHMTVRFVEQRMDGLVMARLRVG